MKKHVMFPGPAESECICGPSEDGVDPKCFACSPSSAERLFAHDGAQEVFDRLQASRKSTKEALPFSESLLRRMRVRWFIGPSHDGFGRIIAVYPDGTCDVESDRGPVFRGWPIKNLQGDV